MQFLNHFSTSKAIKLLRRKGLPELNETDKNLHQGIRKIKETDSRRQKTVNDVASKIL